MIRSLSEYLDYFDSVHRRTVRDVRAMPDVALLFAPPAGGGEDSWTVGRVVGHIAAMRSFFGRAFRGEGWVADSSEPVPASVEAAVTALERSQAGLRTQLEQLDDSWLLRRVPAADEKGAVSGWRILMMLVEHEIHHRSQVNAYSAFADWRAPQLFARRWEELPRRHE